jgi:hypothetical protein
MICCIWYPSGGFGHYINAIISLYGEGFKRPSNNLLFSPEGNSHNLELIAPKYFHDPESYNFDFDSNFNYTVLIDNGINNQGEQFKQFFQGATTIKIGYSDWSWPVVANTMIVKAMNTDIDLEARANKNAWSTSEDWAIRENYFLYLRDHPLRYSWRPGQDCYFDVLDIFNKERLVAQLQKLNIVLQSFDHQLFITHNLKYIQPIITAQKIITAVKNCQEIKIDKCDLWTQAVVYYYLWLEYNFEVPHNNYSNWFTNTTDIVTMLKDHGVTI